VDALTELKREQNLLLVAVESQAQARFLANPPSDYIIQVEDQLIVIGQERPKQG
jgi:K+/H+ antiporter YhaU regulatory subunit KhtT